MHDIAFYPFADGAALHQAGSHRIWVLNHTSAVLWCLFEEHGKGDRLIKTFAEHFNIPREQAEQDIQTALNEFARIGRLPETTSPITDHRYKITTKPLDHGSRFMPWQRNYRLANTIWQITATDPEAAAYWFSCLNHLAIPSSEPDFNYHISRETSTWTLTTLGQTITGLTNNEVLPALLTQLFTALCDRQLRHLLVHAAVVLKENHLLLLPGESAFGKSTLAAVLAAAGWMLFSDELAPLDPDSLQVTPFALPVGIKSRSLPVLANSYPDLESQTAHRRIDGKLIRYLATPQIPLADPATPPAPVGTLVFPRFLENSPTRLERLTPLKALALLANTCSSARPLRSIDVKALLTLAGERPCWGLEYSSLAEAVNAIEGVIRDL